MQGKGDLEWRIARFAAAHHGVATRGELRALGLGESAIEYRLSIGRLHRCHRGVYAIGHPLLSREGRWRAAVAACGRRAVLSRTDAAAHWGLMAAQGVRIHVTTPSRSGRRQGTGTIDLHRVGTLGAWETTVQDAIPVTTVARTLLDIAPLMRSRTLEDLIAQADRLELFDLRAVRAVLAAHPRQRGAPALRALLGLLEDTGPADTNSPAEVAMLQLCDDHRLPVPRCNVEIEGFEVDFSWPGSDLLVEADGYQFHRMPSVFESDRDRDQILALAGYRVVRVTKRQLEQERARTAARLRALLAAASGSPSPRIGGER